MAIAVISAGLWLRSGIILLPSPVAKYGGDMLWALMVFLVIGFLRPTTSTLAAATAATAISFGIECFQIYHAPWIDAIRATIPGKLVLGNTFNWLDFPAYAIGIVLGLLVERRFDYGR